MMHESKTIRVAIIFIAVVAISILLSACGGQSAVPSSTSQASSAPSAQSTSAQSASAQTAPTQTGAYDSDAVARIIEEAEQCLNGPGNSEASAEKAISLYEQAVALGSPYAMYMRGNVFLEDDLSSDKIEQTMQNQEQMQLKALDTAQAMPADSDEANLTIGLIVSGTSRHDEAIPYLEAAAQGDKPFSALAMLGLAELYEKNSDSKQAAAWYEKAIEAGCLQAIPQLAEFYSYNNNPEQAITWYKKAIEVGYRSWYGLGTAYTLVQDYDNAFKAYKQGYDAGINICAYGLGTVYFVSKDAPHALEYYCRYLDGREISDPEHYTDWNENNIKKYVQYMLDNGITDAETVAQYLGEDFL